MNRKGVTLIELIISMVLIAVVSIVSTEFLTQYKRMASIPGKKIMAANYVRMKMEELYMHGLDDWIPGEYTINGIKIKWDRENDEGAGITAMVVTAKTP